MSAGAAPYLCRVGGDLAGATAPAGPDFEAAGPDFEAAGPETHLSGHSGLTKPAESGPPDPAGPEPRGPGPRVRTPDPTEILGPEK